MRPTRHFHRRLTDVLTLTLLLAGAASAASAQSLSLRVDKGLVTLDAAGVSVNDILARWTAVTGLKVTSKTGGGSGAPVTLRLEGVPERQALVTLLRDFSGYVMGERRDPATGIVTIDRLLLLPESRLAANTPAPARPLPRVSQPVDVLVAEPVDIIADDPPEPSPEPNDTADATFQGGAPGSQAFGPQQPSPAPAAFNDSIGPDGAPLGVVTEATPPELRNMPTLRPGQTFRPASTDSAPTLAPVTTPGSPTAQGRPGSLAPAQSPTGAIPQAVLPSPIARVVPASPDSAPAPEPSPSR
jgi:hypothetical protein